MTEDHIKTVVIDPPLENQVRNDQEERRVENPEVNEREAPQPAYPRSWLS